MRGATATRTRVGSRGGATKARASRKVPLGRWVADELRQAILSGRYRPGERLVEDRLSEELGMSRVPVREALRQLAGDGLVEVRPNRGAVVAEFTEDAARDLIEVRASLEGLNARLAARHHRPDTVDELRALLDAGNAAAQKGRVDDLVRLNGAFHEKLAEAGRNTVLWDIMRTLRGRTELVFARQTTSRAEQDWAEHARILAAVIDGDEELAALLAARHVHQAGAAALAKAKPEPITRSR